MTDSPPWMPLNVGDYLKATDHLTVVEHGAYMLLIMRYWQDGGLPENERLVQRYAHLSAEQWEESREVLAALFDEGWKHKRIDAELAKAAEIIGKRKAAGQQRHNKEPAHAEHEESTSSYTRVPPSPEPLVIEPPASVAEAEGARVSFADLFESFPGNPSSSETKALAAWERTKPSERSAILDAAIRYAKWFGQDCEDRGRPVEEGLRFVPHLSTWLAEGQWRDAAKLSLKGEPDPSLTTVAKGSPDLAALERLRGKPIRVYGETYTVSIAELEKARASTPRHAA